jgi:CubicO group peptidase (beta-lactamase class C family)
MHAASNVSASRLFETLAHKIEARAKAEHYGEFFDKLSSRQGFNGVVLIAEKNRIVFQKAYGYANLRTREELTNNDIFQLASVSKQFTAAAVMLLKEKGFLSYDEPVSRYMPEFPYPDITIRHLLTHRAGLPEYRWFLDAVLPDKSMAVSNTDLMRYLQELKPGLNFKSGTRFLYSNTGYAVLAALIERISGIGFDTFMQKAFFEPAGMKQTSVYSKCNKLNFPGRVKGYERNGRETPDNDGFNGITGDKNVFSTAYDLFLWDQALYSNKILKQETLQEAFTEGSPARRNGRNYGFGWRLNYENPEKKIVYHGGWWDGFRTLFLRNLSDGNTLIVLSNKVNHSINSLQDVREELCGIDCDSEIRNLNICNFGA